MVNARVVCSCCALQLPLALGAVACGGCGTVNVMPSAPSERSLAPLALAIAGISSLFIGLFALHASHHRRHRFGHHGCHASAPRDATLTVAPMPAAPTPAIQRARDGGVYRVGDRVVVAFTKPRVGTETSNWIGVMSAGSPDDTWGDWQYVPAGATQQLVELRTPGAMEIRVHDKYPKHYFHVVERLHIDVQPL